MPNAHPGIFDAYPSLTQLPPRLLARIHSELQPVAAADGHELFNVGDSCAALPLLVSGAVRVLKPLPSGRTMPLYKLGPGEFCVLSVSCLLGNVRYPAAGRAAGAVVGAALPRGVFRMLVDEDTMFRNELFSVFAERLCFLMTLIEEMANTRLDERLADLLISRGPVVHATHQWIADELGTAREVFEETTDHFEDNGFVRLHRARVDVLDARHLARVYDRAAAGS